MGIWIAPIVKLSRERWALLVEHAREDDFVVLRSENGEPIRFTTVTPREVAGIMFLSAAYVPRDPGDDAAEPAVTRPKPLAPCDCVVA